MTALVPGTVSGTEEALRKASYFSCLGSDSFPFAGTTRGVNLRVRLQVLTGEKRRPRGGKGFVKSWGEARPGGAAEDTILNGGCLGKES